MRDLRDPQCPWRERKERKAVRTPSPDSSPETIGMPGAMMKKRSGSVRTSVETVIEEGKTELSFHDTAALDLLRIRLCVLRVCLM